MSRRAPAAIGALCALLAPGAAGAEGAEGAEPPVLRVRHLPLPEPTSLVIRDRLAAAETGPQTPEPTRRPGERSPYGIETEGGVEDIFVQRSLEERLVFHFNLGFGLDGGEDPGGAPVSLGGDVLPANAVRRIRPFGFGEAVIGSRGLVLPSLSTYLAAQFRFDQGAGRPAAIPTVHDRADDLLIRSGYAEVDQLFESRFLRPLYLRAGRMFKYGPAIAHIDGVDVGYDAGWLELSAYAGRRASLYAFPYRPGGEETGEVSDFVDDNAIAGAEMRVDLYRLRRIPAVVTARGLTFDGHRHFETGVAYQYDPDVLLGADLRFLDGKSARQSLSLRARISEVTTVSAEVDNRTENDWMYGLLATDADHEDPTDPRFFLNLGRPLPRLLVNVRAGTVFLDNIDLLLRAGAAIERDEEQASATSPSYLEAGGAAEVRLRRSLRFGTSLTLRRYRREPEAVLDQMGAPDFLPASTGILGERSFSEGGVTVGYSAGARVFSAAVEAYGRFYNPETPYEVPEELDELDRRTGARFQVEGWARRRMRLKAEYDVSFSELRFAPEMRTVKSLRVLMEGTF